MLSNKTGNIPAGLSPVVILLGYRRVYRTQGYSFTSLYLKRVNKLVKNNVKKKNPEVTHSALEQIKHLGEITQTWTRYKELAWMTIT